jgi:hypothetical protein
MDRVLDAEGQATFGFLGKNDNAYLHALFITYTSIVPYLFIFTGGNSSAREAYKVMISNTIRSFMTIRPYVILEQRSIY